MPANQHLIATMTIAACQTHLQVIGVNGGDGLNACFRYDVDLVSPDPGLDCMALIDACALLTFGMTEASAQCVHGTIESCIRRYQGAQLSLYQLTLIPDLQRLEGAPQRRSFNGHSAPQIINRLLLDNGVPQEAFRFEHLIGRYPPRKHCIQFDESDLHLLKRLCEEEGISFRFEHTAHSHTLIFADDPATFTEWPYAAEVEHLAERFSAHTCYSTHAGEQYQPWRGPMSAHTHQADHQRHCINANGADPRQQQVARRQLERQRCERRDIRGRSHLSGLHSGAVIRIEGHGQAYLNDQWLLTEVRHSLLQLYPLRGCRADDVIGILHALPAENRIVHAPESGPGARSRLALAHYSNQFKVIQWTLPFRHSLTHCKPQISGSVGVTLTDTQPNAQGEVCVRYDWQLPNAGPCEEDSFARVISRSGVLNAGDRLRVRFFEGDPDQPYVCAGGDGQTAPPTLAVKPPVAVPNAACVHIRSPTPMRVKTSRATLTLTHQGVCFEPHQRPKQP